MKIEIKIDESCTEPKIVIVTDRVTDKINEIIKKLSVEPSEVLAGFRDEQVTVLDPSEIINLKKVRGFDLSFTGTICVSLSNGTVTYVSRRYVAKIKQLLGL